MNELEQRIIAALIFEPRTAEDLATDFEMCLDDIVDALLALQTQGMVTPPFPQAFGDLLCEQTGFEVDEGYLDDPCPDCKGPLSDACTWTYCGGPISKALEVTA